MSAQHSMQSIVIANSFDKICAILPQSVMAEIVVKSLTQSCPQPIFKPCKKFSKNPDKRNKGASSYQRTSESFHINSLCCLHVWPTLHEFGDR